VRLFYDLCHKFRGDVDFAYGQFMGNVCGVRNTREVIKVIDTTTDTTTETTAVTYYIALGDVDKAIERVTKANKRAIRIGQPGYTYQFAEAAPLPVYDEVFDGSIGGFVSRRIEPLYFIEMVDFTILGLVPRLGDWEIIALLEEDEHAGTVSRLFPGVTNVNLTSIKADSMECDYCHTNRSRIKTFVLRDKDGNLIKVGRNCLELYTGIEVSGNFDVTPMKLSDEMDEIVSRATGTCDLSAPVEEVLTLAVGAVKLHGWRSAATARDMGKASTGDYVRGAYGRSPKNHRAHDELVEAADLVKVKAIIDYLDTLEGDGSEYLNNLITCTRSTSGLVSWANIGLVASVVSSYDRFMERQARETAVTKSEWVGTPGTRERFEDVKILDIRQLAGEWSNPDLVKMITTTDAILTWFASKGTTWSVGDVVTITVRIKGHNIYQGCKETQVTHVKPI
jgi:hypothetical protein